MDPTAVKLRAALDGLVTAVRISIPSARLGLAISVALNTAERTLRDTKATNGKTIDVDPEGTEGGGEGRGRGGVDDGA
jgi:hypothetical protein